jgi:hypothetical protein
MQISQETDTDTDTDSHSVAPDGEGILADLGLTLAHKKAAFLLRHVQQRCRLGATQAALKPPDTQGKW